MTVCVAIYARYSTDLQNVASIEDQVRLCKERISREGWKLGFTYADRSMSGANHLRPGYQKLLEEARKGTFDIVVAEALDRISRDQEHVAGFFKQLTFSGVKLITLAEGEISELHVGLKGTMNALFLKDLANKTRRGLRGRVEAGRASGRLSYGYDVVREYDAAGEPVRGKRRINGIEAAIVRCIFEEFVAGKSPMAIAKGLNIKNIPGPKGKIWSASAIHGTRQRGTGILNNELYVGRRIWNRLRFDKDPSTGRKIPRLNPQPAWVIKAVPELRILDDALWQRAKQRQTEIELPERGKKIRNTLNARHRARHLLSGLLKCGVCGESFSIIGQDRYGCSRHVHSGACTNRRTISRQALEARVLAGIKDRLVTPELIGVFIREYNEELNRQLAANRLDKSALEAEQANTKRRIDQIMNALEQGIVTATTKERLLALEARQEEIRTALEKANEAQPVPALHPNLAELYRRKVGELEIALNDPDTKTGAIQALRGLVDAVVLYPGEKRGEMTIELYGELAGLSHIAAKGRKTNTFPDLRVSPVSGTQYEFSINI
ncbi:MAG: recombinase family protein [Rhodospirillales bacterium]|nr:recombinase family protein [Rhodospirillales bacterium]